MKTILKYDSNNKYSLFIVLTFSVFVVVALAKPSKMPSTPSQKFPIFNGNADRKCGPQALLAICKILGVETTLEELVTLSHFNNSGTTMHGLLQAAKAKGLNAVGLEISLEDLLVLGKPCIAFVNNSHFVAIVDYKKDGIVCMVNSGRLYKMLRNEFEKKYSGKALVLSKDDILPDKIFPSIHFQEYKHDFGLLEQNQTIDHTFTFQNKGKTKLIIDKIKSDCSCVATLVNKKEILPSEKGQIRIVFNTGEREGVIQQHVLVHSNDPDNAWVKLVVSGTIKAGINVSPKYISFGQIYPNEIPERWITISFPANNYSTVEKVGSDYPNILIGELVSAKITSKSRIFKVPIKLMENKSLGPFKATISIHTTDHKKPCLNVPVKGEIVGPIKIWPGRFFWGIVKQGQQAKAKVKISQENQDQSSLEIEKLVITPCFPLDFYEIRKIKEGREYEVELTLSSSVKPGLVKGTIRIYTNNLYQPILEIPAIGLIKKDEEH